MNLNKKMDALFSEIIKDKLNLRLKELTLFKTAFESFAGIQSFYLTYENEGDDEGGSYKKLQVTKLNDISVYFNPSYIDEYIGENDFFDESLQRLAFDKKIKQNELEDEITILASIIDGVNENLLDDIFGNTVTIETINLKIKMLEDRLKE